jgi:hypothetical protein
MLRLRFVVPMVVSVLFLSSISHPDIDELLSRYAGENGEGYVEPLVTGFGAGLNSGLYNSARVSRFGVKVTLETRFMLMLFSEDQKTFEASTGGSFNPPATVDAPTIVGDGRGAEVSGDGGTVYHFPGGLEMDALYLACPQLTVGSFFGTEGTVRFVTIPLGDDLGRMTLWGFGGRHSLSQYIMMCPVDLALGASYQKFTLGDVMDASMTSIYVVAGKSLPVVNLYAGLGYETCKMHVEYVFEVEDVEEDVAFDVEGKNRFRATIGMGVRLLVANVSADLSLGRQTVVSLGLGFGI